jgi:hypothetical protein
MDDEELGGRLSGSLHPRLRVICYVKNRRAYLLKFLLLFPFRQSLVDLRSALVSSSRVRPLFIVRGFLDMRHSRFRALTDFAAGRAAQGVSGRGHGKHEKEQRDRHRKSREQRAATRL